ncbi:bifunctional UDP-sugar hydrolase/5'-nucleotidase [Desulfosarcina cetonica]
MLVFLLLHPTATLAQTPLSLVLTANLRGDFSLDIENQDTTDPLLLLAQDILAETRGGADLYLDLGNAFYPGVLSKYSSGAIMMDFLDYFACSAVLVSSKDLQIGASNLEYLQKYKNVRLLSANIAKGKAPIFTPWFEFSRAGQRIAVIGLSSKKIEIDIAEKSLYDYHLINEKEALLPVLAEIEKTGIKHVILLSGRNLGDTIDLLQAHPQIGLALCGGDYTGRIFSVQTSRMDLADGRSVLMLNDNVDYFRLDLIVDDTIRVKAFAQKQTTAKPTEEAVYLAFKNRLSLWKEKFIEDEVKLISDLNAVESKIDDVRFAQLLRDRFDCEIAVVETDTIKPLSLNQDIKSSDFLSMVNRDYFVFLFTLTGDELNRVLEQKKDLVITGVNRTKATVQGYPIVGTRPYRVAATQPAMQLIRRRLRKSFPDTNTWMTATDLLKDDLENAQVVLRGDYAYLDRRFRTTVDAYLSNFIDNSGVKRGEDTETPAGQPSKTYNKWGLENKIDLTIYNDTHRFVFSPYMLYSRQDKEYLNNILRGTFLYEYNLNETLRAYNKLRGDTVVEPVDGLQPILLRETLGVSALYKDFEGKLGFGFEKEIQDPAEAALYGIELLASIDIPFLTHFTYSFDFDAFSGIQDENGYPWRIRSETNNAISANLNTYMSLSFRHKFFYLYDGSSDDYYQNSQFIFSLDFNQGWKFY